MIELTTYQKDMFDTLQAMHMSWDSPLCETLKPEHLPKIGYIAHEGPIIIAAGFLRMVEGNVGMIDTLVTDKHVFSSMRHEGLNMLVEKLIKDAKHMKLLGIVCNTVDEGVINRAKSLSFNIQPNYLLSLHLGDSWAM